MSDFEGAESVLIVLKIVTRSLYLGAYSKTQQWLFERVKTLRVEERLTFAQIAQDLTKFGMKSTCGPERHSNDPAPTGQGLAAIQQMWRWGRTSPKGPARVNHCVSPSRVSDLELATTQRSGSRDGHRISQRSKTASDRLH